MGFYDAKGNWRSDGNGFYDAGGNWVSPGEAFYDGRGYHRSPGDGFYDSKGNWVSPGGSFYDGCGVLQASSDVAGATGSDGNANGAVVGVLFLLTVPIFAMWMLTAFLIQWISVHLYLVYISYLFLTAVICYAIAKKKKHRGVFTVLSYVGNYLCLLSFAYITLVYAIPYVILHEESLSSLFEFTVTLAIGAAVIAVLQFFNYYHENAILELVLGVLFFIVVLILLRSSANGIDSLQDLAAVYGVKPSAIFKVLFGSAI